MGSERRAELFESVERTTEFPMLVLAVAILPLLLMPLVLELPPAAETTVFALDWVIWAAFGLELGVKTYLAPARARYLRAHWVDVLIVILPFLRPLRVARSARALRALSLIRIGVFALRLRASSGIILTRHHFGGTLAWTSLLVLASSVLTMLLEREGGGAIDDVGTALWWALATVTTVGYGDVTPVTAAGRGIGVLLMFVGIGVFGLFAANVAAYFIESEREEHEGTTLNTVAAQLHSIEAQLAELRQTLAARRP